MDKANKKPLVETWGFKPKLTAYEKNFFAYLYVVRRCFSSIPSLL